MPNGFLGNSMDRIDLIILNKMEIILIPNLDHCRSHTSQAFLTVRSEDQESPFGLGFVGNLRFS